MIVRALDVNNDWQFGKGRNDYKSGINAVAQSVQTRLSSFLGDCFFDVSAGIDWFNLLGGKNKIAIQLATSSVILNTQNVISIISLSLDLDRFTRRFTLNYKILSGLGVITSASTAGGVSFLTTEDGDILITEGGDPIII